MQVHTPNGKNDGSKELVILVFKDDAERLMVANHLLSMPSSQGCRAYAMFPYRSLPAEEVERKIDAAIASFNG